MDEQLDFFRQLVRAEILLYNQVDARIKAAHGVSVGTIELLSMLSRLEHPRVEDIVRELDLRVGTASKVVDRLAEAGWLERTPNPHDRRSSWLVITDAGQALLKAAVPTFEASVRELAGVTLSAAEQRTLHGLLGRLAAGLGPQPS